jgi:hypothetical protein
MMRKLEATSKRLAEVEKELRLLREAQPEISPAPVVVATPKLKRPVKRASKARKPKPAARRR